MKIRELRTKVMMPARIRADAGYRDACILDLSSRGLLLQSSPPPAPGAILEIRRGPHVIIGRVVWSKLHRFGVRTQDPLPISALLGGGVAAAEDECAPSDGNRRTAPRGPTPRQLEQRAERSRRRARAGQFAAMTIFGAALAVAAFDMVRDRLAPPLAAAAAQLG